jgi:hypothetical protein
MSRPVSSNIRQNIVEILYYAKEGYGYEIYKHYLALFPKVTQRSIYYHLRKGLQTKEFVVLRVEKEIGEYSWGQVAEKTYYSLGPDAKALGLSRVKDYFRKKD